MKFLFNFSKNFLSISNIKLYSSIEKQDISIFEYIFEQKTKLAVIIFKYIPRCPFYTTYFAFRRTGIHPPSI